MQGDAALAAQDPRRQQRALVRLQQGQPGRVNRRPRLADVQRGGLHEAHDGVRALPLRHPRPALLGGGGVGAQGGRPQDQEGRARLGRHRATFDDDQVDVARFGQDRGDFHVEAGVAGQGPGGQRGAADAQQRAATGRVQPDHGVVVGGQRVPGLQVHAHEPAAVAQVPEHPPHRPIGGQGHGLGGDQLPVQADLQAHGRLVPAEAPQRHEELRLQVLGGRAAEVHGGDGDVGGRAPDLLHADPRVPGQGRVQGAIGAVGDHDQGAIGPVAGEGDGQVHGRAQGGGRAGGLHAPQGRGQLVLVAGEGGGHPGLGAGQQHHALVADVQLIQLRAHQGAGRVEAGGRGRRRRHGRRSVHHPHHRRAQRRPPGDRRPGKGQGQQQQGQELQPEQVVAAEAVPGPGLPLVGDQPLPQQDRGHPHPLAPHLQEVHGHQRRRRGQQPQTQGGGEAHAGRRRSRSADVAFIAPRPRPAAASGSARPPPAGRRPGGSSPGPAVAPPARPRPASPGRRRSRQRGWACPG